MGGKGLTVGGYGNYGKINANVGYNPNSGFSTTLGIGMPIREDGGRVPKAQNSFNGGGGFITSGPDIPNVSTSTTTDNNSVIDLSGLHDNKFVAQSDNLGANSQYEVNTIKAGDHAVFTRTLLNDIQSVRNMRNIPKTSDAYMTNEEFSRVYNGKSVDQMQQTYFPDDYQIYTNKQWMKTQEDIKNVGNLTAPDGAALLQDNMHTSNNNGTVKASSNIAPNNMWILGAANQNNAHVSDAQKQSTVNVNNDIISLVVPIPGLEGMKLTAAGGYVKGLFGPSLYGGKVINNTLKVATEVASAGKTFKTTPKVEMTDKLIASKQAAVDDGNLWYKNWMDNPNTVKRINNLDGTQSNTILTNYNENQLANNVGTLQDLGAGSRAGTSGNLKVYAHNTGPAYVKVDGNIIQDSYFTNRPRYSSANLNSPTGTHSQTIVHENAHKDFMSPTFTDVKDGSFSNYNIKLTPEDGASPFFTPSGVEASYLSGNAYPNHPRFSNLKNSTTPQNSLGVIMQDGVQVPHHPNTFTVYNPITKKMEIKRSITKTIQSIKNPITGNNIFNSGSKIQTPSRMSYIVEPHEMHARLFEVRKLFDVKPGEIITAARANSLYGQLKIYEGTASGRWMQGFAESFMDVASFQKMLNKAPAVIGTGAAIGTIANEE
jgi:hypothetical protein